MAKDLHDKFNRFMSMIPGHVPPTDPGQAAHEQAIQQMNDQANAHANDAANQSFVNDAAAASIRAKAAQKLK